MLKFIPIPIVFLIGYIFGSATMKIKTDPVKTEYKEKVDSLVQIIKDRDVEIDALEESCQNKESEIKYWGQKYEDALVY